MQQFTLYRTNGAGNAKNTVYPIRAEISDPYALCEALRYDHVCAKYKDDRRSESNFECSDVIPMDCDNKIARRFEAIYQQRKPIFYVPHCQKDLSVK